MLAISPHGRPFIPASAEEGSFAPDSPAAKRIIKAFAEGAAAGLLHLATVELLTVLPPSLDFARDLGRLYLTRLCQLPATEGGALPAPIAPPPADELSARALQAPPMLGMEYLSAEVLGGWWTELDALVRSEIAHWPGGAGEFLKEKNPLWRLVGRVTFHLAENKRDPEHPFAFLATYAQGLSAQGRVQHLPLGRALGEYAGEAHKPKLLSLLTPILAAAERSTLARELVDSGDIYQPLAWTARQAHRFLQDIPHFEAGGLVVRVPDWWRAQRPPRPVVNVKIGDSVGAKIDAGALLDFSVDVTLDGEPLTEAELAAMQSSAGGLVSLKGKWVEVDHEKLTEALDHWKSVERDARHGGMTFFEGMRLLSGVNLQSDAASSAAQADREWTGVRAGAGLEQILRELRDPAMLRDAAPSGLNAQLRPYQQIGLNWLQFMGRLGLGACLADDMGLGKTIQVIALLLRMKQQNVRKAGITPPALLVAPASLIGNWKSEVARFAPSLSLLVWHPSEISGPADAATPPDFTGRDLIVTTYGMVARTQWLRQMRWGLIVIDEAQAIKNSGAAQTRAVKELKGASRIALTGTPVENRVSDLWSLFDFLNPGLLGNAKEFGRFIKQLAAEPHNPYGPLRALARPYILRRLKTDKAIIADLPDKTEVNAYCTLSRQQVALYELTVRELARRLKEADGIQRRGVVLASLMRLKQICNHPSQVSGDGAYKPPDSGKFERLAELCAELAERQEKVLVFTQFRELAAPLAEHLGQVFGRAGLILHGGTPVGKRRELVSAFQREDGPPFFVLSLKAGGTGLNLTEASHVIHFDRWWNPAVENQATDRAFRIGQKRNVFVHKFICQGTVEDKIDLLISQKAGLARDLLDGGGEVLLTEMNNEQLLALVSLDIHKAIGAAEADLEE